MTRPETRYARSGDVHVAYQVHGAGATDLVFVPGFVSNLDQQWDDPGYARLLARLGAFARVIRFDKRGTGLSDRLADIPTLEQRMDDVRAVMDAAGSGSAVVFGVSEGGCMSAAFAATHPTRVHGLVLYGAYASYSAFVLSGARLRRYLADIEAGWGSGISLRWLAPEQAEDAALRAAWARVEQHGASPRAALQVVQMNASLDVRNVLPAIHAPTLVLHRRSDARVPFEAACFLAAQIPGARLVELPGDAHPITIGDVDGSADEIEAFVTGVRPRTPREGETRLASILAVELADAGRTAAAAGDMAWAAGLEALRGAAAEALERYRGRPLGPPLGADGSGLALFDGPARAVRCALGMAEAASRVAGVGLRCGVHVGEVVLGAGPEAGLAVQVARRVAGLARSGEVLVTGTVRDLSAGAGLRFRERELRLPLSETGGMRLPLLAFAGDEMAATPAPQGLPAAPLLAELSARERDVLRLMAQGLSNPAIGERFGLSEHTIKRHVANILSKLGQPTRAAAASLAARAGLI